MVDSDQSNPKVKLHYRIKQQNFKTQRCCGIIIADWTIYANINKQSRLKFGIQ